MALENLEIWQGTWSLETQHYHGKLTIGDNQNGAEDDSLSGNLVLNKTDHEEQDYNFLLSIPIKTVDHDKIVLTGRDRRGEDVNSYSIHVLLVRYSQPKGAGNRAIGYFQLASGPDRPKGHKQPIEATKD